VWSARDWETIAIGLAVYVLSGIPLGLILTAYLRLTPRPAAPQHPDPAPIAADPAASPVSGR